MCVCVRERERGKLSECMLHFVRERNRLSECLCMCVRVCVYKCVCVIEREIVVIAHARNDV